MPKHKPDSSNNRLLIRYAGLAMQMLVALGLGVWLGLTIDRWAQWHTPVMVWLLPLLILAAVIIRLVRDTGTKK